MLDKILTIANKYAQGLAHVEKRKTSWITKHQEIKEYLTQLAETLNAKSEYKQGFFVDVMHAFNEEIKGSCSELQSLVFRSGDMPMLVSFSNEKGEKKDFTEHGFQITFTPSVTGEILIMLLPHYSELNQKPPAMAPLAIFTEPGIISMDTVDQIIARGMEAAYYTSFTGIAEQQIEEPGQQSINIPHHNPIGFKRYETTEKPE